MGRQNKTKRTQNKRRKGIRQSARMGEIDGMCLESAVTAMKRWKDVVANFEKQKTRIEKQATIAGKKSVKQSAFGPIALKLVDLGGSISISRPGDPGGSKLLREAALRMVLCRGENCE